MIHNKCLARKLCVGGLSLFLLSMIQGFNVPLYRYVNLGLTAHLVGITHALMLFGMAVSISYIDGKVTKTVEVFTKMSIPLAEFVPSVYMMRHLFREIEFHMKMRGIMNLDSKNEYMFEQILIILAYAAEIALISTLAVLIHALRKTIREKKE